MASCIPPLVTLTIEVLSQLGLDLASIAFHLVELPQHVMFYWLLSVLFSPAFCESWEAWASLRSNCFVNKKKRGGRKGQTVLGPAIHVLDWWLRNELSRVRNAVEKGFCVKIERIDAEENCLEAQSRSLLISPSTITFHHLLIQNSPCNSGVEDEKRPHIFS